MTEPLSHKCLVCGALPGGKCRHPTIDTAPLRLDYHIARIRKAGYSSAEQAAGRGGSDIGRVRELLDAAMGEVNHFADQVPLASAAIAAYHEARARADGIEEWMHDHESEL
jgi:hypothetical protein